MAASMSWQGRVTVSDLRSIKGMPFQLTTRHHAVTIWDKKIFVRAVCGFKKISSGTLATIISPRSINIPRSAIRRAKPISWVTTIRVIPDWADSMPKVIAALVDHFATTFTQQFLDIPQRERKPDVYRHSQADDLGARSGAFEA
ncbi:MAG: hypothetical protein AAGA63_14515 [Pseudomonadota bacterium]